MGKKLFKIIYALLIMLVAVMPAQAFNLADSFNGMGSRAMSLGGAMTGLADDFSAAHYNPAGLAQNRGNQMVIDFLYIAPNFEVNYLGTNVPVVLYNGYNGAVRTDPTKSGLGGNISYNAPIIGGMMDINFLASKIIKFDTNVQMGVVVSIPDSFVSAWTLPYRSPDQPQFIRYGDAAEHVAVKLGLGFETPFIPVLKKRLLWGIGGQLHADVDGDVHCDNVQVGPDTTHELLDAELGINATAELSPILGMMIKPFEDDTLNLGISYRGEADMTVGPLWVEADVMGVLPLPLVVEFIPSYIPEEYTVGMAMNLQRLFDNVPLTLSLDVNQQRWSDYPWTMPVLAHYYIDPGLRNQAPVLYPSAMFEDVTNIHFGMEYQATDRLSIRAGYAHKPSPVPDQTQMISNYLDFDKDIYSMGMTYDISWIADHVSMLKTLPIELGFVLQYQDCEEYTVYKSGIVSEAWSQFPNNYQKSYTVDGDVLGGGVSIRISL